MTDNQFSNAANPVKAKRMIANIHARHARGREALQAEQDNPEMTTKRFAEDRSLPVQHIRRDKQFAEVFSQRELDQASPASASGWDAAPMGPFE